mmetsp:Transcript_93782/g.270986  ORF Transcript_93782/g.270986 Transcript_93782/m.270986 type:complete len:232 (-) Transcript_93782:3089-3784(-)
MAFFASSIGSSARTTSPGPNLNTCDDGDAFTAVACGGLGAATSSSPRAPPSSVGPLLLEGDAGGICSDAASEPSAGEGCSVDGVGNSSGGARQRREFFLFSGLKQLLLRGVPPGGPALLARLASIDARGMWLTAPCVHNAGVRTRRESKLHERAANVRARSDSISDAQLSSLSITDGRSTSFGSLSNHIISPGNTVAGGSNKSPPCESNITKSRSASDWSKPSGFMTRRNS